MLATEAERLRRERAGARAARTRAEEASAQGTAEFGGAGARAGPSGRSDRAVGLVGTSSRRLGAGALGDDDDEATPAPAPGRLGDLLPLLDAEGWTPTAADGPAPPRRPDLTDSLRSHSSRRLAASAVLGSEPSLKGRVGDGHRRPTLATISRAASVAETLRSLADVTSSRRSNPSRAVSRRVSSAGGGSRRETADAAGQLVKEQRAERAESLASRLWTLHSAQRPSRASSRDKVGEGGRSRRGSGAGSDHSRGEPSAPPGGALRSGPAPTVPRSGSTGHGIAPHLPRGTVAAPRGDSDALRGTVWEGSGDVGRSGGGGWGGGGGGDGGASPAAPFGGRGRRSESPTGAFGGPGGPGPGLRGPDGVAVGHGPARARATSACRATSAGRAAGRRWAAERLRTAQRADAELDAREEAVAASRPRRRSTFEPFDSDAAGAAGAGAGAAGVSAEGDAAGAGASPGGGTTPSRRPPRPSPEPFQYVFPPASPPKPAPATSFDAYLVAPDREDGGRRGAVGASLGASLGAGGPRLGETGVVALDAPAREAAAAAALASLEGAPSSGGAAATARAAAAVASRAARAEAARRARRLYTRACRAAGAPPSAAVQAQLEALGGGVAEAGEGGGDGRGGPDGAATDSPSLDLGGVDFDERGAQALALSLRAMAVEAPPPLPPRPAAVDSNDDDAATAAAAAAAAWRVSAAGTGAHDAALVWLGRGVSSHPVGTLDLSGCRLTEAGAGALAAALFGGGVAIGGEAGAGEHEGSGPAAAATLPLAAADGDPDRPADPPRAEPGPLHAPALVRGGRAPPPAAPAPRPRGAEWGGTGPLRTLLEAGAPGARAQPALPGLPVPAAARRWAEVEGAARPASAAAAPVGRWVKPPAAGGDGRKPPAKPKGKPKKGAGRGVWAAGGQGAEAEGTAEPDGFDLSASGRYDPFAAGRAAGAARSAAQRALAETGSRSGAAALLAGSALLAGAASGVPPPAPSTGPAEARRLVELSRDALRAGRPGAGVAPATRAAGLRAAVLPLASRPATAAGRLSALGAVPGDAPLGGASRPSDTATRTGVGLAPPSRALMEASLLPTLPWALRPTMAGGGAVASAPSLAPFAPPSRGGAGARAPLPPNSTDPYAPHGGTWTAREAHRVAAAEAARDAARTRARDAAAAAAAAGRPPPRGPHYTAVHEAGQAGRRPPPRAAGGYDDDVGAERWAEGGIRLADLDAANASAAEGDGGAVSGTAGGRTAREMARTVAALRAEGAKREVATVVEAEVVDTGPVALPPTLLALSLEALDLSGNVRLGARGAAALLARLGGAAQPGGPPRPGMGIPIPGARLRVLSLSGCGLGPGTGAAVAAALASGALPGLESLDLSDNALGAGCARAIAAAVLPPPEARTKGGGGDGKKKRAGGEGNATDSGGANAAAVAAPPPPPPFASSSPRLRSLDLGRNGLGDEAGAHLVRAMTAAWNQKPSALALTSLGLAGCRLGRRSGLALAWLLRRVCDDLGVGAYGDPDSYGGEATRALQGATRAVAPAADDEASARRLGLDVDNWTLRLDVSRNAFPGICGCLLARQLRKLGALVDADGRPTVVDDDVVGPGGAPPARPCWVLGRVAVLRAGVSAPELRPQSLALGEAVAGIAELVALRPECKASFQPGGGKIVDNDGKRWKPPKAKKGKKKGGVKPPRPRPTTLGETMLIEAAEPEERAWLALLVEHELEATQRDWDARRAREAAARAAQPAGEKKKGVAGAAKTGGKAANPNAADPGPAGAGGAGSDPTDRDPPPAPRPLRTVRVASRAYRLLNEDFPAGMRSQFDVRDLRWDERLPQRGKIELCVVDTPAARALSAALCPEGGSAAARAWAPGFGGPGFPELGGVAGAGTALSGPGGPRLGRPGTATLGGRAAEWGRSRGQRPFTGRASLVGGAAGPPSPDASARRRPGTALDARLSLAASLGRPGGGDGAPEPPSAPPGLDEMDEVLDDAGGDDDGDDDGSDDGGFGVAGGGSGGWGATETMRTMGSFDPEAWRGGRPGVGAARLGSPRLGSARAPVGLGASLGGAARADGGGCGGGRPYWLEPATAGRPRTAREGLAR